MNKKIKRVIITAVVIVGIFALIFAGLMIARKSSAKDVNVYSVASLAMQGYDDDLSTTGGDVRCEGFQNISLSETQKVKEIFVKEGQEINAGDAVLSYDTTLSQIDLEKAELSVKKLNLDLSNAQKELNELYGLEPAYIIYYDPGDQEIEYKPQKTPYLISGKGTEEDPMYWLIDDSNTFKPDFFKTMLPKDSKELYVVLVEKEYNALNGQVTASYGYHISFKDDEFSFKPVEAFLPENIEYYEEHEEPSEEEGGSPYTEAEIAQMIAEKQSQINDLNLQIKVAELEYEKLEKELAGDIEYAKQSGTVRAVRDPDEAYKDGKAVVEISAGGGYYIDCHLNELELDSVKVGDKVNVETYNSGVSCEGEITKISILPTQSAEGGSNGNTNVSYYPFTVFVADDAGLTENEYASVSYNANAKDDTSFYIEDMFIRTDESTPYVFVEGEDGKLVKKNILTGKSLWGSYTQIKDGLSLEDFIAFPYGKDVTTGAKTKEAELDDLYSY